MSLTAPILSNDSQPTINGPIPAQAPVSPVPPSVPVSTPLPVTQQPNAQSIESQPTPPPAAGTPSVWKNLVMGAIYGLAGSAGQKHFGGGLAAGAGGVLAQQQQQVENQRAQQQQQFESVKAADSHILALKQARAADTADEQAQQDIADHAAEVKIFNEKFGFPPALTISADNSGDMHSQAKAGLQTLAQQNGGKIPAVITTNSPAIGGEGTHTIDVHTKPTLAQLAQDPTKAMDFVNISRAVQGLPAYTDAQWKTGAGSITPNPSKPMASVAAQGAWQQDQYQQAQSDLFGMPLPTGDAKKDAVTSSVMKQQLDAYKQTPNANPDAVKLLQKRMDGFASAAKDAQAQSKSTVQTVMKDGKPVRQMFDEQGNPGKVLGDAPPTFAETGLYDQTTAFDPNSGQMVPAKFDRRTGNIVGQNGETNLVPLGTEAQKQIGTSLESAREGDTRLETMEQNQKDAAGGDQQAMLSLLANHIGMTLGLQKGARITQAMYDEAMQSAPITGRVASHFDKDGYLTGVTLTKDQMNQMVQLAQQKQGYLWEQAKQAGANYGVPLNTDKMQRPSAQLAPQTATNPKTGQKIVLKGGQWVPLQ